MSFSYLNNISLEEAREEFLQCMKENGFAAPAETIPVSDARGRVTSKSVYAHINAPHYAASAMDGVAVVASDTFGATDTTPVTLLPNQFVVVDTGDPVPENYDAVIMVEELVYHDDGSLTIHSPATPWQHIRQIGEDCCAGEMILPGNVEITPAAMGAMLAGGVLSVEVIRRPTVGIIPTGDEIVPPCDDPKPGDIVEFNSTIFSAMVEDWGAIAKTYPIVPDNYDQILATVSKAAEECDIVLLNAGSSAGRDDYSAAVLGELGEVLCHGISIKPGKPTILAHAGKTPILGVPGYPVSGILVIDSLLHPLIEMWYHKGLSYQETALATLTRPVVSGLKYKEFVRVRMGYVGDKLMASPLARGSGVVTSFMKADGILTVPQGTEGYEAGEEVTVRLLTPKEQLHNTLVVIGSHDPLLDELSDLLHAKEGSLYMSSSHVGSMGGIMAVRRGEAHAAGIHLLDTESGEYNCSFLKKYFPDGGVHLIRCVGRQQVLMVQKGNPLGIEGFEDIVKPGVRYVNRQKGAGTRILMDYLCQTKGIDSDTVYGYEREELTHNSVAVQIESGSADAGLGICSAARTYGLDYIPICNEEYDLLISDSSWGTTIVQQMIETLKSEEFAKKIEEMGGYVLDRPGEEIDWKNN